MGFSAYMSNRLFAEILVSQMSDPNYTCLDSVINPRRFLAGLSTTGENNGFWDFNSCLRLKMVQNEPLTQNEAATMVQTQ